MASLVFDVFKFNHVARVYSNFDWVQEFSIVAVDLVKAGSQAVVVG